MLAISTPVPTISAATTARMVNQLVPPAGAWSPASGLNRAFHFSRLLDWADNWGGVLRVELYVHADNDRAMALYRAMGFVEEGRHKAFSLKNGRYVDSISMARMHPQPPSL